MRSSHWGDGSRCPPGSPPTSAAFRTVSRHTQSSTACTRTCVAAAPGNPSLALPSREGCPSEGEDIVQGTAVAAAKASTRTRNLDFWEHPPRVPASTGPWISGSIHHVSLPPGVPGSLGASTTGPWISGSIHHRSLNLWEHPSRVPATMGPWISGSIHHGSLDLWEHPPWVPGSLGASTTVPWISGSIHHGSLDLSEHPCVQMPLVLAWTFTFTLGAGKAQTASQMWISRPWKSNAFSQNPDK